MCPFRLRLYGMFFLKFVMQQSLSYAMNSPALDDSCEINSFILSQGNFSCSN